MTEYQTSKELQDMAKTSENLYKLASYVVHNVKQEQIDMHHFRSFDKDDETPHISPEQCGTHGCMLGWAPFVPSLEPIPSDFAEEHIWGQDNVSIQLNHWIYSARVFPALVKGDSTYGGLGGPEWVDWQSVFGQVDDDDKDFLVSRIIDMATKYAVEVSLASKDWPDE